MSGDKPKRLDGRIALITGASRGIGRAVALRYAQEGAHVVLVARTVGALEELDDEISDFGGKATLVPLDLKDGAKVDALGPSLYQRWNKLDVLVGNAGVLGELSPLGHIKSETWDQVLDVNLTGNWRLIRSIDPLLRQAEAGRAIFVTSGAASGNYAYWGPYAASKAGLEALVKTYAREVETTKVRANLIDPGPVATRIRAKAFPGEDPQSLPSPDAVAGLFVDLAMPTLEANGELFSFADWAGGGIKSGP